MMYFIKATKIGQKSFPIRYRIHAHNDSGLLCNFCGGDGKTTGKEKVANLVYEMQESDAYSRIAVYEIADCHSDIKKLFDWKATTV